MRWYTGGDYYPQLPAVMRDLPMDLLRSRAYPRNPEVLERGIQQLESGDPRPVLMPQRAAFSKWKTPPSPIGYGQNVISMLAAVRAHLPTVMNAQPRGLPIMDAIQAGRHVGADRMPEPTDNLDVNLYDGYVPLARGAVPMDDLIDVELINKVAVDAGNPEDLRNDARVSALESIGALQDRMNMLAFSNVGVPWFLR